MSTLPGSILSSAFEELLTSNKTQKIQKNSYARVSLLFCFFLEAKCAPDFCVSFRDNTPRTCLMVAPRPYLGSSVGVTVLPLTLLPRSLRRPSEVPLRCLSGHWSFPSLLTLSQWSPSRVRQAGNWDPQPESLQVAPGQTFRKHLCRVAVSAHTHSMHTHTCHTCTHQQIHTYTTHTPHTPYAHTHTHTHTPHHMHTPIVHTYPPYTTHHIHTYTTHTYHTPYTHTDHTYTYHTHTHTHTIHHTHTTHTHAIHTYTTHIHHTHTLYTICTHTPYTHIPHTHTPYTHTHHTHTTHHMHTYIIHTHTPHTHTIHTHTMHTYSMHTHHAPYAHTHTHTHTHTQQQRLLVTSSPELPARTTWSIHRMVRKNALLF